MKKNTLHKILFLLFLGFGIGIHPLRSQTINCNSFCVTGIYYDSTNSNSAYVDIYMLGNQNDFANYPFVSFILDSNGDTIATGTLNFFGQIGNTTTVYPVTANPGINFNAGTYTLYFLYDTVACTLTYPCPTQSMNESNYTHEIKLFPNPAHEELQISLSDFYEGKPVHFELSDITGNKIQSTDLIQQQSKIDLGKITSGIYIATIYDEKKVMSKLIVVE
jgi:hypothetical protein